MKYRVRALKPGELSSLRHLVDLGNAELPHVQFQYEQSEKSWGIFIQSEIGVVLALEDDGKNIIGAFGGMIYQNPNDGKWTASQVFWFVDPKRRGPGGMLLDEFEHIATAMKCDRIFTTNLINRNAANMSRTFRAKGYRPVEIHWAKELKQNGD